jgi:phospholipase/carboxylesterase
VNLDHPHIWRPGSRVMAGHERSGREAGPPTLLLLHGTGGDEHSLLHLPQLISPDAAVLSVRGTVVENGMNRFFARHAEGLLDEDDLTARTHELADWLVDAEKRYDVQGWLAVGFSNGANIATSLLLHHPQRLAGVVAIAGMPPYRVLPAGLPDWPRRALIVNGEIDPLVSAAMTDHLVADLRSVGTTVELMRHPGGHEIPEALLPVVAEFTAHT